jgi:hypothetical protein
MGIEKIIDSYKKQPEPAKTTEKAVATGLAGALVLSPLPIIGPISGFVIGTVGYLAAHYYSGKKI